MPNNTLMQCAKDSALQTAKIHSNNIIGNVEIKGRVGGEEKKSNYDVGTDEVRYSCT